MILRNIFPEVDLLREKIRETGQFSWTSKNYQDDIIRFIMANASPNSNIIEVGCYRGGLTAILAFLCKKLNIQLHSMDISDGSVKETRDLLDKLDISQNATIHNKTFQQFTREVKVVGETFLVIIDGDHSYKATNRDIKSVFELENQPKAIVFHDYGLRSSQTDERVSDSISDCLPQVLHIPIGTSHEEDSSLPTQENPSETGHYWLPGSSEGCLVVLPQKKSSRTSLFRAIGFH